VNPSRRNNLSLFVKEMYSRCVVVVSSVSTTKRTARAGNGIWVFGNGGKRKRALYFDLGIKEKDPAWLVSVAVASNGRSLSLLVCLSPTPAVLLAVGHKADTPVPRRAR
jgi:hypothetical protein